MALLTSAYDVRHNRANSWIVYPNFFVVVAAVVGGGSNGSYVARYNISRNTFAKCRLGGKRVGSKKNVAGEDSPGICPTDRANMVTNI